MTFDPALPEALQRLRTCTWYLDRGHIAILGEHPQALQGVQLHVGHAAPPQGVAWLHGPGLPLEALTTLVCAPTVARLHDERRRLVAYCGGVSSLVALRSQMPVVTAVLNDRVVLPVVGVVRSSPA